MNYETANLKEMTVVGFTDRTNNFSPEMGQVIGGLWQKFYSEKGCPLIGNRSNGYSLGIYTDYSSDEKGDYTVMTACEINGGVEIPQGMEKRVIPGGKYAEFTVTGKMDTNEQLAAVQKIWQEIWKMGLDRTFVCDFEEYRSSDPNFADVHIFIGIK